MKDWLQASKAIEAANGIVLITHRNPDGDGIGSQIGLYHALTAAGKRVYMHNRDGVPRIYQFLAGAEHVSRGDAFPHQDEIDVIISLDAGDIDRLGMPEAFFQDASVLNIDHHVSNTRFGNINIIVETASATGLIALELIGYMGIKVSPETASAIYVALMTDTGSFRLTNTTPDAHVIAAELIEAGADPWLIARSVYETSTAARLHMLAACLGTIEVRDGGRSAWLHVDHDMYAVHGADVEDTEGFIEYARSLEGVEIAVFIRPEDDHGWKVSFRGKVDANVGALAASLGGGGHRHASGCVIQGSLLEVQQRVQQAVSDVLA